MNNQELIQERELNLLNIKIYEYEFETCNAVTIFVDGFYHIGIKKNISSSDKYWLLEHELSHIQAGATYHVNDDDFKINQAERKANDRMLAKSRMVIPIYNALQKGYTKEEICAMYNLPSDIYDCSIEYIKRRLIMNAYLKFMV